MVSQMKMVSTNILISVRKKIESVISNPKRRRMFALKLPTEEIVL